MDRFSERVDKADRETDQSRETTNIIEDFTSAVAEALYVVACAGACGTIRRGWCKLFSLLVDLLFERLPLRDDSRATGGQRSRGSHCEKGCRGQIQYSALNL